MTKRKTKKRITLFFVLLVALSAILGSFAAFALPNAQDYDFSVLTNANLIETDMQIHPSYQNPQLYLENYAERGSFVFSATQNIVGAPSAIMSKTIGQLAPYLKVGDVVYFSWVNSIESAYSNKFQLLRGSTFSTEFYSVGEEITVTQDFLNSYMVFYPFASGTTAGAIQTYSNFRCNLGEVKPYAPYLQTETYVTYLNGVYQQGHNEGVLEEANRVNAYLPIFSKSNLGSAIVYYGQKNGFGVSDRYIVTEAVANNFNSNGYSFSTASFPSSVLTPPVNFDIVDTILMSFQCLYTTGNNVAEWLKASNLSVTVSVAPNDRISFTVVTSAGDEYTKLYTNDTDISQNRTFTNDDFGLQEKQTIKFIEISYVNFAKADFPNFLVTTATPDYATGYEYGYKYGEAVGFADGKEYSDPLVFEQGRDKGYAEGMAFGEKRGYNQGKEEGYYQGKADANADEGTFYNLLYSVVQAPVTVLFGNGEKTGMLNFEVLGVNMSYFYLSVLTLGLVLWAIRKVNFLT